MSVQSDIDEAIRKFREIPALFTVRKRRAILRKGAKVIQQAAKANIKDSDKPHHRYKKAGASKNIKAPKGQGTIVATYAPGNLRRSIKVLAFRKAKFSLFVGPKLAKKNNTGTFSTDGKVDGYYAHMVEYGTVNMKGHASKGYMRRAADAEKANAEKIIINGAKDAIIKWADSNAVR